MFSFLSPFVGSDSSSYFESFYSASAYVLKWTGFYFLYGVKYFMRDLPDAYPFTFLTVFTACFLLKLSYKYYPSFYYEAWDFKPFIQCLGHQFRFSTTPAPDFNGRLALGSFRCRFSYAFNYIPFAPGHEPGPPIYFLPRCGNILPCRPDSSRTEFPMNLPAFRIGVTAEFDPAKVYLDPRWIQPLVEEKKYGHLIYYKVINQKAEEAAKEMWDFLTSGPNDPDLFRPDHPSAYELEPVLLQLEHMVYNLETPLAVGLLFLCIRFLKAFYLRR